tara:strand:- start:455 stop:934 length:480 start_codon:yes stop_codon:yes gene_type:complete
MKEYTIFIDSANGSGALTHEKKYLFDWSILPEGEYELTFTFLSNLKKVEEAEAEQITSAMTLEAVMPFSSCRYAVKTDGYANHSNVLGFIKPEELDNWTEDAGHFSMRQWVSQVDNPSMRLFGKPQGNDFLIRLLKYNGTLATYSPVQYNMIIKLKHIC